MEAHSITYLLQYIKQILFFLYLFFISQLHTPLFMGTGEKGYQLTVLNFTPLISNSIL